MSQRNSTLSPFLLVLILLIVSCNGLSTKSHQPLVFALNLSSSPVSLALVKNGTVLVNVPSLGPLETKPLTRLAATDAVVLRQGVGGSTPAKDWTDPSGAPYTLKFDDGHLYAIVVDKQGQAALYSLPETYSNDPKLCIVNVTDSTLSQVQAAPAWAKNVKVYSQDVVPVVPSEFYSFAPQTLGLFWQTLDQSLSGTFTSSLGFDGKPLRMTFEPDRFYLLLAGEGIVRDLTPTLD